MNDIYNIDLTRALPPTLANDPVMLPLAKTIAAPLQKNIEMAKYTLIFHRIDELEEDVLDILARDMHVDWWSDSYPIIIKRRILKESVRVHMRLGTKFAVLTALRAVFPNTEVKVWYEYGGTHHRFRIILDLREALTVADLPGLRRALDTFNRLTVHLDDIVLRFRVDKAPVVVAGASVHGVNHLTTPGNRETTRKHSVQRFAVINAGLAQHTVQHTATPLGRESTLRIEKMPTITAGHMQHTVRHTSIGMEV